MRPVRRRLLRDLRLHGVDPAGRRPLPRPRRVTGRGERAPWLVLGRRPAGLGGRRGLLLGGAARRCSSRRFRASPTGSGWPSTRAATSPWSCSCAPVCASSTAASGSTASWARSPPRRWARRSSSARSRRAASTRRSSAVDLSYFLGDVLLLGFVIGVLAVTGWRPGRALGVLSVGLAMSALADGFFLYQAATGVVGDSTLMATFWPASAVLVGCAAWIRTDRVGAHPAQRLARARDAGRVRPDRGLRCSPCTPSIRSTGPRSGSRSRRSWRWSSGWRSTFRENLQLLEGTRRQALTDALTGLANRRRLMDDLTAARGVATEQRPARAAAVRPRRLQAVQRPLRASGRGRAPRPARPPPRRRRAPDRAGLPAGRRRVRRDRATGSRADAGSSWRRGRARR